MRYAILLPLLLLGGCRSENANDQWWQPSEVSVAPYGEWGEIEGKGSPADNDRDTWNYGAELRFSWPLGLQRESQLATLRLERYMLGQAKINRGLLKDLSTDSQDARSFVEATEPVVITVEQSEPSETTVTVGPFELPAIATDGTPVSGIPLSFWWSLGLVPAAGAFWIWRRAKRNGKQRDDDTG